MDLTSIDIDIFQWTEISSYDKEHQHWKHTNDWYHIMTHLIDYIMNAWSFGCIKM